MLVKVVKSEIRDGKRNDGTEYKGASAVVIFDDKKTAARVWVPDDLVDPSEVVPGEIFDMYRDESGYVLVFNKFNTEERR